MVSSDFEPVTETKNSVFCGISERNQVEGSSDILSGHLVLYVKGSGGPNHTAVFDRLKLVLYVT